MTNGPDLKTIRDGIYHVSLVSRIHSMKANPVVPAPDERNVLGVRPAKRHGRAGRATAFHSHMRQVRSVPNLFGEHAALVRKIFDRCDEGFGIAARSEFVVTAFSC